MPAPDDSSHGLPPPRASDTFTAPAPRRPGSAAVLLSESPPPAATNSAAAAAATATISPPRSSKLVSSAHQPRHRKPQRLPGISYIDQFLPSNYFSNNRRPSHPDLAATHPAEAPAPAPVPAPAPRADDNGFRYPPPPLPRAATDFGPDRQPLASFRGADGSHSLPNLHYRNSISSSSNPPPPVYFSSSSSETSTGVSPRDSSAHASGPPEVTPYGPGRSLPPITTSSRYYPVPAPAYEGARPHLFDGRYPARRSSETTPHGSRASLRGVYQTGPAPYPPETTYHPHSLTDQPAGPDGRYGPRDSYSAPYRGQSCSPGPAPPGSYALGVDLGGGASRHHPYMRPSPPRRRSEQMTHPPRVVDDAGLPGAPPIGAEPSWSRAGPRATPSPLPSAANLVHASSEMRPTASKRRGKLPKEVTDYLRTWLLDHVDHPYPTEEEKRQLCDATGLSMNQISNWFINARRRILTPIEPSSSAVDPA